jgi:hypothetical protein
VSWYYLNIPAFGRLKLKRRGGKKGYFPLLFPAFFLGEMLDF